MAAFELLYLDVDDEITSAATRIRRATAPRLGLVLPYGSRLATSRINFRLLAREAEARGRRVEVVTPDPGARALAAAAGLAAHPSVSAFESGVAVGTPRPDRVADDPPAAGSSSAAPSSARGAPVGADAPTVILERDARAETVGGPRRARPVAERIKEVGPPRRRRGRRLAIALIALVLVGITAGGSALVLLPAVEIVVVPAIDELGPLELRVTAQEGVTQPDPANLLVPATRHPFDVSASDTFVPSGVRLEETASTGSVLFQNCDTGRPITIPAGAVVSTAARVRFRTIAAVTVTRASIFPFACKTGSVGIEAEVPGPEGDVAAGQITRVPSGFDELVLTVTNPDPTTGGSRTEFPVVTQEDVDAAILAIADVLIGTARSIVESAPPAPPGTRLFLDTLVVGAPTLDPDPATLVGLEVTEFGLGATAAATVLGVETTQVEALADARIRSRVKAGWRLVEASIDVEVGEPLVTGRTITFPATATATATREIDLADLRARIRGLALHEARAILDDYGAVTLAAWPDWVTTVPTIDGRISLTLGVGPDATPGPSGDGSPAP